jgi:cysteine desulfurase/selenocysteine lyase
MNLSELRNDFPVLKKNSIVYLDTACQSLRPRQVIEAVADYYENYPACSGRSMHKLAARVTQKCDNARAQMAKFLGAAKKEEVVFTRNTTEGINLVANSLDLKPGDVVLITGKEHNSNLIPWQMLVKKTGIQLKILPPKRTAPLTLLLMKKC